MTKLGANIAIIHDGKILLTKRHDFEVWCIPGGAIEPGESIAETAIREAREETGLVVELVRLVGMYSRIGGEMDIHSSLFVARPIGGEMRPQAGEVVDIGFFSPDMLPEHIMWWHRPQIADALNGVSGVAYKIDLKAAATVNSRQELYALQESMALPPVEFYKYFFEANGTDTIHCELGS